MTGRTRGAPAGLVRAIRLVAARETAAYFDSKIAYVFVVAFVLLANGLFMNRFFVTGLVDMTAFFELMPFLLPFFLPALTMRLWAEEKKARTLELLLTLPVRPIQCVAGKYLASLLLFALTLLGTVPIVLMLLWLGEPDLPRIAAGYLGLFLTGALFLAAGMLVSALSADQIVTFVASALVCLFFVGTGNEWTVAVLDGQFPAFELGTLLKENVSVMPHFAAFVRGALGLPAFCYLLGLTAVFLWVNAVVLERDRE